MSVRQDNRLRVALLLVMVFALPAVAQTGRRPLADTGAAQAPQSLVIGLIDFYGLHQLSAQALRGTLSFKEGDTLTLGAPAAVLAESETRLAAIGGVVHARTSVVCCDHGRAVVFVGIEEEGAPSLHFRPAPQGVVRLAADVVQAGDGFAPERFIVFARRDLPNLRAVLHDSADARHRALAVKVLGYVVDKQAIVDDLVFALDDPDERVRNDAVHTLLVFSEAKPTLARPTPRVPYEPFIALLDSPVWSDRNTSSGALAEFSQIRDPLLFAALRARAMFPLVEIARWRSTDHALSAFKVLGRMAGYTDEDIMSYWERGEREKIIRTAVTGHLLPSQEVQAPTEVQ
jgi:hypothetical protein